MDGWMTGKVVSNQRKVLPLGKFSNVIPARGSEA